MIRISMPQILQQIAFVLSNHDSHRKCVRVLFLAPPVTTFGMDSGVTGLAKGDQIISCVSATLGKRNLVMYLLGWRQPSVLLAQLADGMLLHIAVPDAFPSPSIPAAYSWVPIVLLVALGLCLGVFLAESSIGQLGAAGIGAGAFGFCGHHVTLLSGQKNSHCKFHPYNGCC